MSHKSLQVFAFSAILIITWAVSSEIWLAIAHLTHSSWRFALTLPPSFWVGWNVRHWAHDTLGYRCELC